jgi:hypothetical protein
VVSGVLESNEVLITFKTEIKSKEATKMEEVVNENRNLSNMPKIR